jgi:putative DNA primase/helicase
MMAAELCVCNWSPVTARHAAEAGFNIWLGNRGGVEPAEVTQAIGVVRLCIEQFGASKFQRLDADAPRVLERLGWTCGNGAEQLWMIPPESWKAITAGHDAKLVAKVLGERGMLIKAPDGWQCVRRIEDSPKRVYVVTAAIFDGERDGS